MRLSVISNVVLLGSVFSCTLKTDSRLILHHHYYQLAAGCPKDHALFCRPLMWYLTAHDGSLIPPE